MKYKLHTTFIIRSFLLSLAFLTLIGLGLSFLPSTVLQRVLFRWFTRPVTAPPPPTITAPVGTIPLGNIGLQEWVVLANGQQQLRGSGFLLRLANGEVLGVTTAHSLPDLTLVRQINFVLPSTQQILASADTLYGLPGTANESFDLSTDYVLVRTSLSQTGLIPDARGLPQIGERVSLFSGLGGTNGARRELMGTVFEASPQGFWVVMDDWFEAGMMSGSPVLSQHTGQVLGMVIAGMVRGDQLTIGFHPIGSIVQKAQAAQVFPKLGAALP